MDQGCACAPPVRRLGAACLHPRPRPGHAIPPATSEKVGPMKQDYSIDGGQAAHGQRTGRALAAHRLGMGPSQATPVSLPGEMF